MAPVAVARALGAPARHAAVDHREPRDEEHAENNGDFSLAAIKKFAKLPTRAQRHAHKTPKAKYGAISRKAVASLG